MADLVLIKGSKYFFKRITETAQIPPTKAQAIFKNPFDKKSLILGIGVVPNSNFKGQGVLEILLNGAVFLEASLAGDYSDVVDLNIPIPEKIALAFEPTKTIEFKIHSGSGVNVGLAIGVLVGEGEADK